MRSNEIRRNPRKKASHRNPLTAIFLVLCLPVGLAMMWGRKCTWHIAVKSALSCAVAAAVVAVFLAPAPVNTVAGGIEVIGSSRKASIYGPELPATAVQGYTARALEYSVFAEDADTEEVTYYYADDDQSCYHTYKCKFAYQSGQRLTLFEATTLGYTPCGRCLPNG